MFNSENLEDIRFEDIVFFKDNFECLIKFLQKLKLLPESRICSCGDVMKLYPRKSAIDGYSFRCKRKSCNKESSLRQGSFFSNSHLSLYSILKLMYLWSRGITTQKFLMLECRFESTRTVVDWKNFMRDVCLSYYLANPVKIGGPGVLVQIDESLICKRKYGVGRILRNESLWIVGGVDEFGRVFMVETEKRDAATLENIICNNVEGWSIIHSDGWRGYARLNELGFLHETVIHEREFVSSTGVHTNRIEGIWSAFKRKYRSVTNKKKSLLRHI